jgi:hypothetical protein
MEQTHIKYSENTRSNSYALGYNPEVRGLETQQGKLLLSIYLILPTTLNRGVCSASSSNEYQRQN